MTGNRSIKTEELNDQHILLKIFCQSAILEKLNKRYILVKEFMTFNNSEKTKWATHFIEKVSASQQFWKN